MPEPHPFSTGEVTFLVTKATAPYQGSDRQDPCLGPLPVHTLLQFLLQVVNPQGGLGWASLGSMGISLATRCSPAGSNSMLGAGGPWEPSRQGTPSPSSSSSSSALCLALDDGPICHGRSYQGLIAPDNLAPRILGALKPPCQDKVVVLGGQEMDRHDINNRHGSERTAVLPTLLLQPRHHSVPK